MFFILFFIPGPKQRERERERDTSLWMEDEWDGRLNCQEFLFIDCIFYFFLLFWISFLLFGKL